MTGRDVVLPTGTLTGTAAMVRLVLRRDRVRLPVWTVAISGLVLASAAAQDGLYPTAADRLAYARSVGANPASLAMAGPGYRLDSLGGIVAFETGMSGYVAVAIMSVLLVVRHSRAEEEAGRTELVRAAAAGRHAGPAAAGLVVAAAGLLVGCLVGAGVLALGLPVAGSVAFGLAFVLTGTVFTSIGLLVAQLAAHARAASGLGMAVLGGAFVLRAAGDVTDGPVSWLSWLSPLGWAQAIRPFAQERWWVALLPVLASAALLVSAVALLDRRDLGAGLLPTRPGPTTGSHWLGHPLGLAVRLHRAGAVSWLVGLAALGVAYGSVGQAAQELVDTNDALAGFFAESGASLTDAYFATTTAMLALMAAGLALQVTSRLATEEAAGRAEPLLATSTSRVGWAGAHVCVAIVGGTLGLLVAGVGTGATDATLTGDRAQLPRLLVASLGYAPAIWVLVGLAAALYGWSARAIGLVWAALTWSVVVSLFGDTLRLPGWARALSPFDHVPHGPGADPSLLPLGVLTAVAVVLLVAGAAGLARRDVG